MIEYKLQFKPKMSSRAAKEMILFFARHGDHGLKVRFRSDADIKRALESRGYEFGQLVAECRGYKRIVPLFENIIGSTARTIGSTTISSVDRETGQVDLTVKGPGLLALYGYQATFENAVKARNRAVEKSDYTEFLSTVTQGIASIEGYINYRAELWKKKNQEQLIDSHEMRVGFDTKIDDWLPRMALGRKLDKTGKNWQHFRFLRHVRDDINIHPKISAHGISLADLAEQLNMFRTGIAGVLIQLHQLFEQPIPAVVIRSHYAPDVEVVTVGSIVAQRE